MNPILEEILAEEHRKGIAREVEGIRIEEQALEARGHQPNWFARAMQSFGGWLIARGESLVERYEIPQSCTPPRKHGYAH
jgi:hypothetical protein